MTLQPSIILGSQSPRRKEILHFFSLPFQQVPSDFDEESVVFSGDPIKYANAISDGKSKSLVKSYPNEIILTADTIVYHEGKIYGKPANEIESFSHLKDLSGNWHSVFTSLTIRFAEQTYQLAEETRVLFNQLTAMEIQHYQQSLPCLDKAGGYMIQGPGSLIVNRIEGCYYNVMGLPINGLRQLLGKIGIDLWLYIGHPTQRFS